MSVLRNVIITFALAGFAGLAPFCLDVNRPGLFSPALHAQETPPYSQKADEAVRRLNRAWGQDGLQSRQTAEQEKRLYNSSLFGVDPQDEDNNTALDRRQDSGQDTEFADDPFARFEPRGGDPGEPLNRELGELQDNRAERRQESADRLEALSGDDAINRQNEERTRNSESQEEDSDREIERETEAERNFEEEFLAAERELESEQPINEMIRLVAENRRRDRNQPPGLRGGINTQSGEEEEGQPRAPRRRAEADENDITGSIQPLAPENIYEPQGKRLGTFLLFPEFTISAIYSDNPTASINNGPGDEALELTPHIIMRSDWSRHALELEGQLTKGYFEELTSENIEEWFLRASGRLDIRQNQYIEIEGRLAENQDDRGDIDALNTDTELAVYQTRTLSALYHVEWNRLTLELSGNLNDYDYEDALDSLGQIINNDDQDYLESGAAVRLGYTFHPGLVVYAEGQWVERDYDAAMDDLGFIRDNSGQTIAFGMIYDITALLRFEGVIGHEWLDAEERRFADLKEMVYSAALTYRLSEKTTLSMRTTRDIESTDLDGAVGFIETEYSFGLIHYFRPHLRLNASLIYEEEDYPGPEIEEETFSTLLSLQYIFNQHMRLLASYEYIDSNDNTGGDYRENIFRLGLNFRP